MQGHVLVAFTIVGKRFVMAVVARWIVGVWTFVGADVDSAVSITEMTDSTFDVLPQGVEHGRARTSSTVRNVTHEKS